MTGIQCPDCGSMQHYSLNDNRLQCAACRKKYTVGKHTGKLSLHTFQLIAQSFWRMVPATAAAAGLGINSKTLQKNYDVMRRAITAASESYAIEQFGAARIDPALFHAIAAGKGLASGVQPLFCLADSMGKVSLLTAGEELEGACADVAAPSLLGWVYARDQKTLSALDLDRTHFLAAAGNNGNNASATFWLTVKRGLVRYHGGFRKNFHLFVREMEFRFNNNDEESAVAFLMEVLQRNRNLYDRR
jgi:transposase